MEEGRSQVSRKVVVGSWLDVLYGEVRDALSDPRAEALGLGALQDAVRHSFGLLQQALGRHPQEQGLLGPLFGGNDPGVRQGVVANTGGGQVLFASGALIGARGAEVDRSGHRWPRC